MNDGILERLDREPEWMKRPLFDFLSRNAALIVLLCSLFLLYGFFLAHKIDLVTADLGRHIKNGEMLFTDSSVLSRNFYSYTHSDFPVINHHWGSGVLFYAVWKAFGFTGVQLFFILISFAALWFFLKAARLYAPWSLIGFAAIPAVFLLGERTEIRPEAFSYLFAGVFFFLLCEYREHQTPRYGKLLLLFVGVELLWVNTHIYFLLGPLLVGAFLLESLLARRAALLRLSGLFAATLAATLVNPFGYRALTGAFGFFENFGYRLAENQPIWFMDDIMRNPNFLIFKIVFAVSALIIVTALIRHRRGVPLAHLFVFAGISSLAWLAIRNISLFGLFSVPFIAGAAATLCTGRCDGRTLMRFAAGGAAAALMLSLVFVWPRYFPYWRNFGLGLEAGNNASMEFLKEHDIRGPYFSNYDIGGYLIFYLFPGERVFVDNRPEAYPTAFFQEIYIPIQQDADAWSEALKTYAFNAIVFSHRDATPWGQQFLISRIQDALWVPVFADDRVIIFVRRSEANTEVVN